jgi:hypothetical protein
LDDLQKSTACLLQTTQNNNNKLATDDADEIKKGGSAEILSCVMMK